MSLRRRLAALTVIGALALTGCASTGVPRPEGGQGQSGEGQSGEGQGGQSGEGDQSGESDQGQVAPVRLSASPADAAVEVNPITVPTVKAVNGTIDDVVLKPASGGPEVSGELSDDSTVWKASERLQFHTNYTFSYTAVDAAGESVTKSRTFATVMRPTEANAWTYPKDGMHVGVGQPIEINFSEPVTNKDAVEKAISISTSKDQAGAFHWYTDQMLRYRPKNFWKPNSTITIDMDLFGVEFGNGMIGNEDSTRSYTTGDKMVAVADSDAMTLSVYRNDKLVKVMPTTMGMKDWPSTSGIHVIMGQYERTKFSPGSIGLEPGDEDYYEPTMVNYANRISTSGEFVHQALDSALPYLGNTNVSHGCIGLNGADAEWFYTNMTTGDIVKIINSEGPVLEPLEGYGDWNISWSNWVQ